MTPSAILVLRGPLYLPRYLTRSGLVRRVDLREHLLGELQDELISPLRRRFAEVIVLVVTYDFHDAACLEAKLRATMTMQCDVDQSDLGKVTVLPWQLHPWDARASQLSLVRCAAEAASRVASDIGSRDSLTEPPTDEPPTVIVARPDVRLKVPLETLIDLQSASPQGVAFLFREKVPSRELQSRELQSRELQSRADSGFDDLDNLDESLSRSGDVTHDLICDVLFIMSMPALREVLLPALAAHREKRSLHGIARSLARVNNINNKAQSPVRSWTCLHEASGKARCRFESNTDIASNPYFDLLRGQPLGYDRRRLRMA